MYSQRALAVAEELGQGPRLWATMWHGSVLLERGRAEEAGELLEALPIERVLGLWQGLMLLADRGRVRGRARRAGAGGRGSDRGRSTGAKRRLSSRCPQRLDAGGRAGARPAWAARAGPRARFSRARGRRRVRCRPPPRHRAVGVRLARPPHRGADSLRQAARILERSPACLEHVRALVDLGTGLHARGHREQAREPLLRGLDLADRCGAVALAEQARTELVATGARPRRRTLTGPDALTPAELRTARMAAQGLSNRRSLRRCS